MIVTIECYGAVRAATERKVVEVELADDATVGDALDTLAEEYSGFERCRRKELVVMRNSTHVEETDAVSDGEILSVSNPPMVED